MACSELPCTVGWSVDKWVSWHRSVEPEQSLELLKSLCAEQDTYPEDTAWISLASEEMVEAQWAELVSRDTQVRMSLPLYGVPVAVKDNIDVRGMVTTAACPSYGRVAARDARVIAQLREAGAIFVGKTNMDQFATGLVGTRSPYGAVPCVFDGRYISGGSSSGSASVVGRGIVPLALSTDTAGSGRVPAALNNLVGLKPTRGVVSCNGVVPACKSLDCVGVLGSTLSDVEICFKAMISYDPYEYEYARKYPDTVIAKFPGPVRIGLPAGRLEWFNEVENERLFNQTIGRFKSWQDSDAGEICTVTVDMSPFLTLAKFLYEGPWVLERLSVLKEFYESNPPAEDLDPTVTEIIAGCESKFTGLDVFQFEYKRQALARLIEKIMEEIDVLVVPTCPLNPTLEEVVKNPMAINSRQGSWTNFTNLADLTALAIPSGFRTDGLPQGITLIGKKFSEFALLELASRFLIRSHPNGSRLFGRFITSTVDNDKVVGPYRSSSTTKEESITVAVVGAHLKGLPLHSQLESVNATYVATTRTSASYQLYALPKSGPILKPGLRRVQPDENGSQIEVELYSVPTESFGEFIKMVPPPLGIGSVELETGEFVKSFICEEFAYKDQKAVNITSFGGFKPYVSSIEHQLYTPSSSSATLTSVGTIATSIEDEDTSVPLFSTVLVANRGEIAARIIKTLKKMGIRAVAIYSTPDKYSRHVRDADTSVHLDGSTPAETYLNIEKVIKAAKSSNTEAIIPGYGFLSENAEFAQRCVDEGIIFIGPTSETISCFGLKHSAREIANVVGVPLVPGSELISDIEEAKAFSMKIGYPVMIKSTAGGGGIGLQRVESEKDLERVFEVVQRQGQSYFGNSGVFVEKFIGNARHIEVQILGDGNGKVIALGERDCTLQRRNQKVIEETPAPSLQDDIRGEMKRAAIDLCAYLKYRSAGTVEFIYDQADNRFYFLEVNTRLQVEHPITEMVTSLDLVELMVRIAAKDKKLDLESLVPISQGVSIEARIYAENPSKDFKPSPGKLVQVKFPTWARVDTYVSKGSIISHEYDPMIAKLIVHGNNRMDAINKMHQALNETVLYGCMTNVDYLRSIVTSSMFQGVEYNTDTLNHCSYEPNGIEIISPGAYTTVQDYPGRSGYWRVGVPPSGPMDSYSFRLANRIVGNHPKAPGLEITLSGPTILFHSKTYISISGGKVPCKLNDRLIDQNVPVPVTNGDILTIGKIELGCRAYLAIRGGIIVPEFLGSRSTFALGNMGGFNGRILKVGDTLFVGQSDNPSSSSCPAPEEIPAPISDPVMPSPQIIPSFPKSHWTIGVMSGPHSSDDFFEPCYMETFLTDTWKVHYNSNRFGIRLIGPKPVWARKDGGEAGLHPSNTHDYVYALGALNFTGDESVIITVDGPSLGGFVCQVVIPEAELWKVGQLKPGDTINFVPISYETAKRLKQSQDGALLLDCIPADSSNLFLDDNTPHMPCLENPILARSKIPNSEIAITYRQAGDRYILIEYGENQLDLNISYHLNALIKVIENSKKEGIIELSPGVRSLLVEFDGSTIQQKSLLSALLNYEFSCPFVTDWKLKSKIFRLPMAFEDSRVLECVKRYEETIRSKAPWLPNNVDFIAEVNEISREDVKKMLYTARFIVLGLGDVFLGAPCAVPLDPRHRFLGTKYNPSRTYTPNAAVGIGGMYMCIYGMDSPGGYQLVGRTIPIWDQLQLADAWNEHPWLLTPFDQVEFYPVSEEQIDIFTEQVNNGVFEIDVEESVFDSGHYWKWIKQNSDSILEFQSKQGGEIATKFAERIQVSNQELLQDNTNEELRDNTVEYPESAKFVHSEYSGRLWKQLVSVGDTVTAGSALIVIEAMKTEITVISPSDGEVHAILCKNGDMVESGDLIVVIV